MITLIIVDILIIAILLAGDLLSKYYISAFLAKKGGVFSVIKDVLTFRYSENRGAAFSILEGKQVILNVFVGIVIAGILAFLVWHLVSGKYKAKGSLLLHIALSMSIAGGLGNLVDRIAYGYVRDFIEYTFIEIWTGHSFAICNLADVFITIGVILIIIYLFVFYLRSEKDKKHKSQASENTENNEQGDQ